MLAFSSSLPPMINQNTEAIMFASKVAKNITSDETSQCAGILMVILAIRNKRDQEKGQQINPKTNFQVHLILVPFSASRSFPDTFFDPLDSRPQKTMDSSRLGIR